MGLTRRSFVKATAVALASAAAWFSRTATRAPGVLTENERNSANVETARFLSAIERPGARHIDASFRSHPPTILGTGIPFGLISGRAASR